MQALPEIPSTVVARRFRSEKRRKKEETTENIPEKKPIPGVPSSCVSAFATASGKEQPTST